jgi:hypothetical protein
MSTDLAPRTTDDICKAINACSVRARERDRARVHIGQQTERPQHHASE